MRPEPIPAHTAQDLPSAKQVSLHQGLVVPAELGMFPPLQCHHPINDLDNFLENSGFNVSVQARHLDGGFVQPPLTSSTTVPSS